MEITAAAQWINTVFEDFDMAVTSSVHWLHGVGGGFFTPFFEFISFFGKGGIFLILLSLCLAFFKPTRRFGSAMCLGLAIGAIFTNLVLKVYIARPRPYADESSLYYQLWLKVGQNLESDYSFPSGHTTAAFDSMTPVMIMGKPKYKILALTFAVLMCFARIYLVVHFPSDVLGGIVVGVLAGCLGVLIAARLPRRWYQWDTLPHGKHEI
ncbi:MAG: phosphatase PAP2 family protein [Oscillospiraceae bacterium]|nr:phosphatase PAP2 family protein [Oscillospiraceae bacterium]